MVHPDGENHTYKIFQYEKKDGKVSCPNFIKYETNREVHSSTKHRGRD